MKRNAIVVFGFMAALLLIIDITHSLSRTGGHCDECGGSLEVVGQAQGELQEITYFCCEECQKYSVVVEAMRDSR